MDNIELNGANTANILDSQATTTDESFTIKIGKTRFIVRVLVTENAGKPLKTALREACMQDILNEARHINLAHLEKIQKTS